MQDGDTVTYWPVSEDEAVGKAHADQAMPELDLFGDKPQHVAALAGAVRCRTPDFDTLPPTGDFYLAISLVNQ